MNRRDSITIFSADELKGELLRRAGRLERLAMRASGARGSLVVPRWLLGLVVVTVYLTFCTENGKPPLADNAGDLHQQAANHQQATNTVDSDRGSFSKIAELTGDALVLLKPEEPAKPPVQQAHDEAVSSLSRVEKELVDLKAKFAAEQADSGQVVAQRTAAIQRAGEEKARADKAEEKLASEWHRALFWIGVGMVVVGAIAIGLAVKTMDWKMGVAGGVFWGFASLLHFYDTHETEILIASACAVAAFIGWLIYTRVDWHSLKSYMEASHPVIEGAVNSEALKTGIEAQALANGTATVVSQAVSKAKSLLKAKKAKAKTAVAKATATLAAVSSAPVVVQAGGAS